MSSSAPEPRSRLHSAAKFGRVRNWGHGSLPRTQLLFAITDWEWAAWYKFGEKQFVSDKGLNENAPRDGYYGRKTLSQIFQPRQPRRVDEFILNGMSPARLETAAAGDTYLMRLWIYLDSAPTEIVPLQLKATGKSKSHPAHLENGHILFLGLERHTAALFNDHVRFKS